MSNDEVTERAVEMLRQAMASGAVAFVEKVRAGEVDPSAPMTEAFGDFPRKFLSIRADLFDGLLVTPERDAAVAAKALREAAEAIADTDGTEWPYGPVIDWLHDRADRIEVTADRVERP